MNKSVVGLIRDKYIIKNVLVCVCLCLAMCDFINVYISRPSNDRTKARLYSNFKLNEIGPLVSPTGFRFLVSPDMKKEDITTQCSEFRDIRFDTRPEVNALMFLCSIIIGWAYRVKITETYRKNGESSHVLTKIIFPMVNTLLNNPYTTPIKKLERGVDGWITVNKTRRTSKTKSAYCYATSILDNTARKNNWRGIFDLNFQLTILAIIMNDEYALRAIKTKFHAKFSTLRAKNPSQGVIFKREVNKFKIFNFLISYY